MAAARRPAAESAAPAADKHKGFYIVLSDSDGDQYAFGPEPDIKATAKVFRKFSKHPNLDTDEIKVTVEYFTKKEFTGKSKIAFESVEPLSEVLTALDDEDEEDDE